MIEIGGLVASIKLLATFNNVANKTVSYEARLQPKQFQITGGGYNYMRFNYSYYNDGRINQLIDLDDVGEQLSLRGSNQPLHSVS